MQVSILNEKLIKTMKMFLKYFSYLMAIVYIVLASILMLTNIYATALQPIQRYGLGGILFAYGVYRCYRVYKEQNNKSNEEQ